MSRHKLHNRLKRTYTSVVCASAKRYFKPIVAIFFPPKCLIITRIKIARVCVQLRACCDAGGRTAGPLFREEMSQEG